MPFDPDPGMRLTVGGATFEFVEHPNAPGIAFGAEGGLGTVYKVKDLATRRFHAWKVMKETRRDPSLGPVCDRLRKLATLPGLCAAQREFVSSHAHADIVSRYPELDCSILMPWILGRTWFDTTQKRQPLSPTDSLRLALGAASVFAELETAGLAHTDISPGNVIFDLVTSDVQLVDLEGVFRRDFPVPPVVICGTPGYQHLESNQGLWCPEADRFAGAILLTEMLVWSDPALVAGTAGESLFSPDELQHPRSAMLGRVLPVLNSIAPSLADLLKMTWSSRTLSQCPRVQQWHDAIVAVAGGKGINPTKPAPQTDWVCPLSVVTGYSPPVAPIIQQAVNPLAGFSGGEKPAVTPAPNPVVGWHSGASGPADPKT